MKHGLSLFAAGLSLCCLTTDLTHAQSAPTKWTVQGTVVQKDGQPFFLKGMNYSPTPIGGATYQPGVGDWFSPPWWTGKNDIGARDIPLLQAMGINSLRTYFTWYWMPDPSLAYRAGITQDSPLATNPITGGPGSYTVDYNHKPFLDACFNAGIFVVLGIGLDGGPCFNFGDPSVSAAYQNFFLQTAEKLASEYGTHPAVVGFCLSNEQNQPGRNDDSRVWTFYKQMRDKIKLHAPDKLVTIGFQDDANLYNGTHKVSDFPGAPSSPYNGMPVEQVISDIADVWGLNIYSGMSSDFPIFQKNVVEAGFGRPLWVTEWGIPGGKNVPDGAKGKPDGNASARGLTPAEQRVAGQEIEAKAAFMAEAVSFVSGGFYFAFSDEWWKNDFTPVSEQNASSTPDFPEEYWGVFAASPANGRNAANPDPKNPDTLTPRQPMVDAVKNAYTTVANAFAASHTGGGAPRSSILNSTFVPFDTAAQLSAQSERPVMTRFGGAVLPLQPAKQRWYLDPWGPVEVLEYIKGEGLRVILLRHDNREVFLPEGSPDYVFDFGLRKWLLVHTSEDAPFDPNIGIFDLTPPVRRQMSDMEGPANQVPIP